MKEKPVCAITHPQILEGPCPRCKREVRAGIVCDAPPGPTVRWNWSTMEENLRGDDAETRSLTVHNLSQLDQQLPEVIPLLSIALEDEDSRIRDNAEIACQQIGGEATEDQVQWLEGQVIAHQNELAARITLLGAYFLRREPAAREARAGHVCWLITHHPNRSTAGRPDSFLMKRGEAAAYERAKELWLKQCETHADQAVVLGNAAMFFAIDDRDLAASLLKKAQLVDPENAEWHEQLGHLYSLPANNIPEEQISLKARQAFVELETAEQLRSFHAGAPHNQHEMEMNEWTRLHHLPKRAKAAFAAGEFAFAAELAAECLSLGSMTLEPERMDGNAIHVGHLVLGRVALLKGDVEGAKHHLLESANHEGSPSLDSFGPNMSLAKELLEKGEREVVLDYFERCRGPWKCGKDDLDGWTETVKQGGIPDFSANLFY